MNLSLSGDGGINSLRPSILKYVDMAFKWILGLYLEVLLPRITL